MRSKKTQCFWERHKKNGYKAKNKQQLRLNGHGQYYLYDGNSKNGGIISFYFHEAEFNIEPELYDYGNEVFWI